MHQFLFLLLLLVLVTAIFGSGGGDVVNDIGGAGYAVVVDVTSGESTRAIVAAFPLPLCVALEALPFAIPFVIFQLGFTFLVSLGEGGVIVSGWGS